MTVKYSPSFLAIFKKANVRIRKNFKERIKIFSEDPFNPYLNNHTLKDEYQGYRSIDITSDWRAIYEEVIIVVHSKELKVLEKQLQNYGT